MLDNVQKRQEKQLEIFVVFTHLLLGTIAVFVEQATHLIPFLWVRILLSLAYVCAVWVAFRVVRKEQMKEESRNIGVLQSRIDDQAAELLKWERFWHLDSHVLSIVGEFLKNRYKVDHSISTKIAAHLKTGTLVPSALAAVLREADKERRGQIKSAFAELSSVLVQDEYKKPEKAQVAVQDLFKVSFYSRAIDATGSECLLKKWRYYPNEGEPRTEKFHLGEGAAGTAWERKKIVVCEKGHADQNFKVMHDGQRSQYASMICVPAIIDIPLEKISEVHGVLTLDTPVRAEYFAKELEQFWADLLQPICNVLVYSEKNGQANDALVSALERLDELQDTKVRRETEV